MFHLFIDATSTFVKRNGKKKKKKKKSTMGQKRRKKGRDLHRRSLNLVMYLRRLDGVGIRCGHSTFAKPVHFEVILPRFVRLVAVRVGNNFARCARYHTTRVAQEEFINPVI